MRSHFSLICFMVLTLIVLSWPGPSLVRAAATPCLTGVEWRLLDQVNTFRGLDGIGYLSVSPSLTSAARHQAESMARYSYFPSDYSLQFEGPNHDETITWQENIANAGYPDNTHTRRAAMIGSGSRSVEAIVETLTGLPAYRSVLEDAGFQAIGIGFAADPANPDEAYWTVTLGSLVDARLETCGDVAQPVSIASATSSANSESAELAIDGNLTTTWQTTGSDTSGGAWLQIDLGAVQSISRIEWMFAEPGKAGHFSIAVSADGSSWTSIASKGDGAVDQWRRLSWSGTARFVRFAFEEIAHGPFPYLSEVRVFG